MNILLVFAAVVFISSFLSGMTGMGGGILLMAFMSPVFPPAVLIPLHGTIQLAGNSARILFSLKKIRVSIFIQFFLGTALGAAIGSILTIRIPLELYSPLIGVSILLFTWIPAVKRVMSFRGEFVLLGCVSEFLSLFIGAVGPLTAPFFLNSELTRDEFVPTKAACQIPVHLFKVAVYMASGFIISQWTKEILIALPAVAAGTLMGKIFAGKLHELTYRFTVKIVITLLAARMIVLEIIRIYPGA